MTADSTPFAGRVETGAGWAGTGVGRALAPVGWRDAVISSARLAREEPALLGVGLLGYLARGGLVLFALPIVVLPTPTGISNFLGGTALTGAGPSDGLIRLAILALGGVLTLTFAGTVLGAVADLMLFRETMAVGLARQRGAVTPAGRDAVVREVVARVPLRPSLVLRVTLVRLVSLVPVAVASAWGASRLVAATYHQLILPDDLAVPLGLRVLHEAADAAIVVIVAWLFGELVGGLAVRQLVARGTSVPAALVRAVLGLAQRPATGAATFVLGTLLTTVVTLAVLLASAAIWSRLQGLLADDSAVWLVVPATLLLVAVWGGGLVAVGATVTWRSILTSFDVLRAR